MGVLWGGERETHTGRLRGGVYKRRRVFQGSPDGALLERFCCAFTRGAFPFLLSRVSLLPAMPVWVLWVLLVVGASGAAPAFPGPSSKERGKAAASWDEVNVLAHGLLQLGHGLKEHVERTRGQLRELSARLSLHNASLALLERRTDDLPRLSRAQRLLDDRLVQLSRQLRALQGELSLRPHSLDGSRTGQAGQENGSGSPRAPDNDALQVSPWKGREGGPLRGPDGREGSLQLTPL